MTKPITADLQSLDPEKISYLLSKTMRFRTSMLRYQCALMEIETKLRVLDTEFNVHHDRNPIESISSRLKTPRSIFGKLSRKDLPITVDAMEENLFDIAGVRIVCSFEKDVYHLRDCLANQNDIEILVEKDYIKSPKPNGYRSLHLTVRVPVFFAEKVDYVPVEIQFRTIAMDFWASLEHKIRYKKNISDSGYISEQLLACALSSRHWDEKMAQLMEIIEKCGGEECDPDDGPRR